jgi:clan AA aspartic protease
VGDAAASGSRRLAGVVTERGDALIELLVSGPAGNLTTTFVVDTGFTGALVLPEALVRRLALRRIGANAATLADGSQVVMERFDAEVQWPWGSQRVRTFSAPSHTALVGARLLSARRLEIDYPARTVEIT